MVETEETQKSFRAQRRAHWQSHIEDWKRSGQSKQAYCREHGLNRGSFQRWCGRLLRGKPTQLQFIPVRLPSVLSAGYALELTLANGRVLRIGGDADPAWVSQLVQALDGAC